MSPWYFHDKIFYIKIQIYPWYKFTILPLKTVKFLLSYNHTKIYRCYKKCAKRGNYRHRILSGSRILFRVQGMGPFVHFQSNSVLIVQCSSLGYISNIMLYYIILYIVFCLWYMYVCYSLIYIIYYGIRVFIIICGYISIV